MLFNFVFGIDEIGSKGQKFSKAMGILFLKPSTPPSPAISQLRPCFKMFGDDRHKRNFFIKAR